MTRSLVLRSAILALLGAVLLPGAAQAQDANALAQRLDRLERDIQTLSKMVVRGPDSVPAKDIPSAQAAPAADLPGNAVARIGVRLDNLENDLRTVTGRIEELTYNLDQLSQRVDRLTADVDFRLSGLEQKAGLAGPPKPGVAPGLAQGTAGHPPAGAAVGSPEGVTIIGKPAGTLGTVDADMVKAGKAPPTAAPGTPAGAKAPASATAAAPVKAPATAPVMAAPQTTQAAAVPAAPSQPAAALPAGTPDEQYHYAFGLLRKHQFDQAEVAFREFLAKNNKGQLASNARYWLGETHYARAEYVKAAEVFLQGFEADPKGAKAPDSLLKLAMSLGQLGQNKEACGAIAKLFSDYPNASSSLKRTATRQQHQLSCK